MQVEQTPAASPGDESLRFGFGSNWRRFLAVLDDERIEAAERSFHEWLGVDALGGKSFLDVGSGSGLSSLVAMRLGAARVHSFDYDPESVACTRELKRRFFPASDYWTIEQGDASDSAYLDSLGMFDTVYSWGVLHHTGRMWHSMDNACRAVALGGRLWIAIYNDQGPKTHIWRSIKWTYNQLPRLLRPAFVVLVGAPLQASPLMSALKRGDVRSYIDLWRRPSGRGMSRWHDLVDWVGGYPFEVARPSEITNFCGHRGFVVERGYAAPEGASGMNQFVFRRESFNETPRH